MKELCILRTMILMFFFTLTSVAFAQVMVSDPISVTDGDDSFGKKSPRLIVNTNGEVMVFWMRTGNEAFFISTKTELGFSDPIQIPFGGLNPNLWSGSLEPNIAAQGDDIYVTFEVYGDAIYVTHSSDGGTTWEDPVAAFTPPLGRRATIPIIAVDQQGHPYVAYVNTNAAEEDAYYGMVRSTDFGASYLPEVDVSAGSNGEEVCECCNGHIEIADNGDVYVAFRNNDSNLRDIWMVRSADGGASFTDAYDVDETDWMSGVCPSNGPHFAILDDEIVNVFFSGAGESGSGVYFSSMDPNSGVVQPTFDLLYSDVSSSNQNRPRLAGQSDTLGVVWQESYNGSVEIAITVSTNGSEGINTETLRLTDNPSLQWYPDVLYNNGVFHVVYEDNDSGTVLYHEVSLSSVGLEEQRPFEFSLSPNPSSENIQVIWPLSGPMEIQIIDAQGRTVFNEQMMEGRGSISVSDFNPGYYQVLLRNSDHFSTKSFIIE
jgi:hypothetical protein